MANCIASSYVISLDNIGIPQRLYNLAFTDNTIIGVNDGIIQVSLKENHRPTQKYIRKLRRGLPEAFPNLFLSFAATRGDSRDGGRFRPEFPSRRSIAACHSSEVFQLVLSL